MPARKDIKSPALRFAYERYIGNDPEQAAVFEEALVNAEIARKIYDLREEAGLSQRELAKQVGTQASVICRLEDADYEGHSISMLKRIATALGKRLDVNFLPESPKQPCTRSRNRESGVHIPQYALAAKTK